MKSTGGAYAGFVSYDTHGWLWRVYAGGNAPCHKV